ncbi:MAG: glycosyltransferase family 2 protein, partial [Angustibacter sp.]
MLFRSPEAILEDLPCVSILIVNWNSSELLDQALNSLQSETRDISFEVVVVDNGSRDGSLDMLEHKWPQVRRVELPTNHGFGVANNIGFKHCRANYILLLNADTICLPTTVSGLVRAMDEHPEAGCIGARHLNPDLSLQWSMDDFPSLLNDSLRYLDLIRLPALRGWLRKKYPAFSDHDVDREVDWVNGACLIIRKEVLDTVGGFDPYFFIYAEELDWCFRIWRGGWTVRFTPTAEVIHIHGGSFNATDGRRTILIYQSLKRYYHKHYSRRKYRAIFAMVAINSLWRILALAALQLRARAGRPPSQRVWELVTQQSARSPWRVMY